MTAPAILAAPVKARRAAWVTPSILPGFGLSLGITLPTWAPSSSCR
jgi:hypothetical protein